MLTLGIDIGSTTSKAVIMQDGTTLVASSCIASGIGTNGVKDALREAFDNSGLSMKDIDASTVTGYGRVVYEDADYAVSELTCHALGGRWVWPDLRTIIDIGGQDAKIIALNEQGNMSGFLMNDKCAAGTGRFLDVMAGILKVDVSELGAMALSAKKIIPISSTCTVFAESEVISQLSHGEEISNVVGGICESVAVRVSSFAKRVGIRERVCLSGGVAKNEGVKAALEKALGVSISTSEYAQVFGAIGAAISAYKKKTR